MHTRCAVDNSGKSNRRNAVDPWCGLLQILEVLSDLSSKTQNSPTPKIEAWNEHAVAEARGAADGWKIAQTSQCTVYPHDGDTQQLQL